MGIGAVAEPLLVVTLLFGGTWFNRNSFDDTLKNASGNDSGLLSRWRNSSRPTSPTHVAHKRSDDESPVGSGSSTPLASENVLMSMRDWSSTSNLLGGEPLRRPRKVRFFSYERMVTTPNTRLFKDRLLSRLLRRFPFLVEAWYWALLYWVYQLGRAFTALTLVEGTVNVARKHALQLIHLEQSLHLFVELPVQHWFLERPTALRWINRIYSYIHIPGSILFLVVLYYLTTTCRRRALTAKVSGGEGRWESAAGPGLYEARRRTMALCNLIAFVVFTLWPCMPPRLLSAPEYNGDNAEEAKSYGFVDTVHNGEGASSVWTTNRFCNQYAAMPSLHFGYSLLIGLTIATLPLRPGTSTLKRAAVAVSGIAYPALILTAIVATANHFVLDAVAGAIVCGIAWNTNGLLLNLLVLEDYFLCLVRIHKPVNWTDSETAVHMDLEGERDVV